LIAVPVSGLVNVLTRPDTADARRVQPLRASSYLG